MRIVSLLLLYATAAAGITYTYDSDGRLIQADYGNGSVITYTYDNAGNLTGSRLPTPSRA